MGERKWPRRDTCPGTGGPGAEGAHGTGSRAEEGQGLGCPAAGVGGGLQRERGWRPGKGRSWSPVTPSIFPILTPKLPGSSRLPRQPLLPGAVTKETPCPPLPPSPTLACPPNPTSSGVEGGRGNRERNPDSRPRKGVPDPRPRAHPQACILHRTAGYAATAGRAPPTPCPSPGSGDPQHTTRLARRTPHLAASPHPLRLSVRPRPLSSAAAPPSRRRPETTVP